MGNSKKISLLKKLSVTLIFILGSAGTVYFYEAIRHFNTIKSDQIIWIVLFGISFSYVLNYNLEILSRFSKNAHQDK